MKKIFGLIFMLLLCAGCVTGVSPEELSEKERRMQREERIGEEMIEAFRKNDFEAFVKYIPAGGKEVYNKDKFNAEQREIASRMGKIVSSRFLTRLEMEPMHQLVWAVRFQSYTLKGEEIFREALFSIVIGEVDERLRVFLFGFK
ncbi:MAG: hypothetical protein E7057_04025 [Lentisphaerae bacterium]|nr:hypothetical protein [Lentisphaerota bacterium]